MLKRNNPNDLKIRPHQSDDQIGNDWLELLIIYFIIGCLLAAPLVISGILMLDAADDAVASVYEGNADG